MELHRLETICEIVRSAADEHSADPRALATALHQQHVTAVDLAEALDDVIRLPREQADEMGGLLRLVIDHVTAAEAPR